MSVWLLCILVYSSLGLSCLVLSGFPRFSWLFPFPMLGKFSAITSSNIFSGPLSLSLFFLFAICFRHYVFFYFFFPFSMIASISCHFIRNFRFLRDLEKEHICWNMALWSGGRADFLNYYISFRWSVIVWHIYTLHRDHHHKSSFHSSPYRWIPAWYRCSFTSKLSFTEWTF